MSVGKKFRGRRVRRQNRAAMKNKKAKPKHRLISGRTGQSYHKKPKSRKDRNESYFVPTKIPTIFSILRV